MENRKYFENEEIFLQNGEQTVITERVKKLSEGINGNDIDKLKAVLNILDRFKTDTGNKELVFRKRSADEIIEDGYLTGCTDEALVTIALLRSLSIPAKYIETVDKEWLKTKGSNIKGHVYVSVFLNNEWVMVDPSKRKIDVSIESDGRGVVAEGLDSWDIGINSFDSLKERFFNI